MIDLQVHWHEPFPLALSILSDADMTGFSTCVGIYDVPQYSSDIREYEGDRRNGHGHRDDRQKSAARVTARVAPCQAQDRYASSLPRHGAVPPPDDYD